MAVEVLDRHVWLDAELPGVPGLPQPVVVSYLERPGDSRDLFAYLPGVGPDAADFRAYMAGEETHSVALAGGPTPGDGRQPPEALWDTGLVAVSWFLRELGRQHPGKRLWLIGFSLGADTILRLCEWWRTGPTGVRPPRPHLFAALLLDPRLDRPATALSGDGLQDHGVPDHRVPDHGVPDHGVQGHGVPDYGLAADRLAMLTATLPHSRVVFSAGFAAHARRLERRLATLPNFSYELVPVEHADLAEGPCLGPQLRRLREQTVGALPRRRLATAARARGA